MDTIAEKCSEQMSNSEEHAKDLYQHTRQHSETSMLFLKDIRSQQKTLLETVQRAERMSSDSQIKTLSIQLEATSELNLECQFGKLILAHLEYTEIQDRYELICEAHQSTFEWIFQRPEKGHGRWDDFPRWLRGGPGDPSNTENHLYFITGKAGSGKSTLMKYIFDDDRTVKNLRIWAGDSTLLMAGFFFWNSGVEIQMSGVGLLRTLLHQILKQKPGLVRHVLSKRWKSYQSLRTGFHDWTWPELKQVFQTLAKMDDLRIACFIDGLDEFYGDHVELADFLLDLTGPTVKLCAASRPWLVFEDAFENKPNLLLEQLTRKDIQLFVIDAFDANKHFTKIRRLHKAEALGLVEFVVIKASGVFLWVHLVVKSLLQGMANGDRISDLKRRLDSLPSDLEQLFDKLLRSLEPFYFSHASQLIQLLKTAPVPPTPLEMAYADEEDLDVVLSKEIRPWTLDEAVELSEGIRRRLNSRCKGLIGVTQYANSNLERVEFLHRTVKDYVQKPRVWASILEATPEDFDPTQCWANSILMELKTSDPDAIMPADMFRLVQWGMQHAEQSENATRAWQTRYLDELERTINSLVDRNSALKTWAVPDYFSSGTCFLDLVFQHGMIFYLRERLQDTLYSVRKEDLDILLDTVKSSASPLSSELVEPIQKRRKTDRAALPTMTGLSTVTTLNSQTTDTIEKYKSAQLPPIPVRSGADRKTWSSKIALKMEGFWTL